MSNVILAHEYKKDKHNVDGWWMSIKYDGVRALWNSNTKEMESRTKHIYNIPECLVDSLLKIKDPEGNLISLDGELWLGNDTFALMSGLARRHEISDSDSWSKVKYMVFDSPDISLDFEARIEKVKKAIEDAGLGSEPNIEVVKYKKIVDAEHVEKQLRKVEARKGEGLVLRKPKSMYEYKRSSNMLKVKSFMYAEAVVIGLVEGTGKYSGMVGSLHVETEISGKKIRFKIGSGLTDAQRYVPECASFKNIDYIDDERAKRNRRGESPDAIPVIGDKVTFRYKELTKLGNPSMPTFVDIRDYE